MKGIREVSISDLTKTVKFYKKIDLSDRSDKSVFSALMRDCFTCLYKYDEDVLGVLAEDVSSFQYLPFFGIRYWDLNGARDGNVIVEFVDKERLVARVYEHIADPSVDIGRMFTSPYSIRNYISTYEKTTGKAFDIRAFIDDLYKYSKLDKNKCTTLKNAISAWARMTYMDVMSINCILKQVSNVTKQALKGEAVYVYVATDYIENHYDLLSKTCDLKTCMTKGVDTYKATHYTPCDYDKAEAQGYRCKKLYTERTLFEYGRFKHAVFTPNVACYNNTDEWGLLLFSYISPEEIENVTEYPFVGRAIGARVKGEGKEAWEINRYYGDERLESRIFRNIKRVDGFVGRQIPVYISTGIEGYANSGLIAPFIDGDYGRILYLNNDTVHFDSIGRPYYLMEITDETSACLETHYYVSDYYKGKQGRLFNFSNGYHLVSPNFYSLGERLSKCAITGEGVTSKNGWQLQDGTVIKSQFRAYVSDLESAKKLRALIEQCLEDKRLNFERESKEFKNLQDEYTLNMSHYRMQLHNLRTELSSYEQRLYNSQVRINDLLRELGREPEPLQQFTPLEINF